MAATLVTRRSADPCMQQSVAAGCCHLVTRTRAVSCTHAGGTVPSNVDNRLREYYDRFQSFLLSYRSMFRSVQKAYGVIADKQNTLTCIYWKPHKLNTTDIIVTAGAVTLRQEQWQHLISCARTRARLGRAVHASPDDTHPTLNTSCKAAPGLPLTEQMPLFSHRDHVRAFSPQPLSAC